MSCHTVRARKQPVERPRDREAGPVTNHERVRSTACEEPERNPPVLIKPWDDCVPGLSWAVNV